MSQRTAGLSWIALWLLLPLLGCEGEHSFHAVDAGGTGDGGFLCGCSMPGCDPLVCDLDSGDAGETSADAGHTDASDGGDANPDAGESDGGDLDAACPDDLVDGGVEIFGSCFCETDTGCSTCPIGTICDLDGRCVTPKYCIRSDGTVLDLRTHLLWPQSFPDMPLAAGPLAGSHSAENYCQELALGGHSTGWRMASLPELFSIYIQGDWTPNPAAPYDTPPMLDTSTFLGTDTVWFTVLTSTWLSTGGVYPNDVGYTMGVDFRAGSAGTAWGIGNISSVPGCVWTR